MTALATRLRATSNSEWIKLRSVRSVPAVLVAIAAVMLLGSWIASAGYRANWRQLSAAQQTSFDPTYTSLRGIDLAQLLVGALGVLVVTGEYATGLIRITFSATPQRGQVLVIKATIFAALVWVIVTALSVLAFFLGQRLLGSPAPHASMTDPGVLRAVLGGGVYLLLVALFGLALGTVFRATAAALSALFGILLVLPLVVRLFTSNIADHIAPYLPSNAGGQFWQVVRADPQALGPWQGVGVFALYVVATGAAAFVLIRKRDV